MSSSSRTRLSLVQRTSFSTAAALNMLVLEMASQNLVCQIATQKSRNIRSDANVPDLIPISRSTTGSIQMDFGFPHANEALWYLLRAALRTTETAATSQISNITSTSNVLTGTDITTGMEVGDVIRVKTSADVVVGYPVITDVDLGGPSITVAGVTIPNGATYKVQRGARMKNGTNEYFFDMEVAQLDVGLYELFEKVVVNSFDLTIADGQIVGANFGLMGAGSTQGTAPLCLGYTNPTAGAIFSPIGVPTFRAANTSYSARSFGLAINNNIRIRTTVSDTIENHILGYSWGDFDLTTRFSTYQSNWTEMSKYIANTASSLMFVLRLANGQAMSFSIPEHKYTQMGNPTPGANQETYQDGAGQGILDALETATIRVQRWSAA